MLFAAPSRECRRAVPRVPWFYCHFPSYIFPVQTEATVFVSDEAFNVREVSCSRSLRPSATPHVAPHGAKRGGRDAGRTRCRCGNAYMTPPLLALMYAICSHSAVASLSRETRCCVHIKQKAMCHPKMTYLTYCDTWEINRSFETLSTPEVLDFLSGQFKRGKHVLATQVPCVRVCLSVLFVVVYTVAVKMSPLEVISVTHIIKSITNTMKPGLRHVASVIDVCVYSCLQLHVPQKRTGNAPSQLFRIFKSVTCN